MKIWNATLLGLEILWRIYFAAETTYAVIFSSGLFINLISIFWQPNCARSKSWRYVTLSFQEREMVNAPKCKSSIFRLSIIHFSKAYAILQSCPTVWNPIDYSLPWTEEHGRLQSIGLQRVRYDWSNWAYTHTLLILKKFLFEMMLIQCDCEVNLMHVEKGHIWCK